MFSVCVPQPATSSSELLTWCDSYYHAYNRMTEDILLITYEQAESAAASILGATKSAIASTTHWYRFLPLPNASLAVCIRLLYHPPFFIFKFEQYPVRKTNHNSS